MKILYPVKSDVYIYKCRVCGYQYDPSVGDKLNKIPAGVDFLDLPDSWRCPVCKYPKKEFRKLQNADIS